MKNIFKTKFEEALLILLSMAVSGFVLYTCLNFFMKE